MWHFDKSQLIWLDSISVNILFLHLLRISAKYIYQYWPKASLRSWSSHARRQCHFYL